MKAYISTKFENVGEFVIISKELERLGINTSIDWIKHESCKPFGYNKDLCKKQALEDLEAIQDSDIFIMYYDGKKKGSGMFLELGYALGLVDGGKDMVIIAYGKDVEHTSMFIHLDNVILKDTLEDVVDYLKWRYEDV